MFMLFNSTKFHCLSVFIITMVFIMISGFISKAQEENIDQEKQKLKVTILLYSGRPNPTYLVDDEKFIDKLKTLLEMKKSNAEFEDSTVIPSILGYNGIVVDNPGKIQGLPKCFAVYKGNIEVRKDIDVPPKTSDEQAEVSEPGQAKEFLVDENEDMEDFLLNQGLEKGVINEEIMKRIKRNEIEK